MSSNQLAIIPAGMQLPAHLQTPDVVARIAADNAAAAGGIKIGGFPRISIKGGKFHIVEGGETQTIFAPPPSPPGLPLMHLEVIVLDANPNLTKTYYAGDYQAGDDKEPDCSSDNGVTPDAHIAAPQSSACATCPQNRWGSKVSKASGKDVKACTDNKRLAIIPAENLDFKALGLAITPAALTDWGKYMKALSERNVPIYAIVTTLTFDHTAAFPKLQFAFNRFLEPTEYERVMARKQGDDVKAIVSPSRTPALPAPTVAPAAAPAAQPAPAPAPAAPSVFGGTPAPAAPAEAPKRTRAPRKAPEAAQQAAQDAAASVAASLAKTGASVATAVTGAVDDLMAHLPPEVRATIEQVGGVESDIGKALLAKYPRPAAPAQPAPAPAATSAFGAPAAAAPAPKPEQAAQTAATSLAEQLRAKLAAGRPAAQV